MKKIEIKDIRDIFSPARLSRYQKETDTIEKIIQNYHEDICLSEALIPTLHYFEVCLRNRLNRLFQRLFGNDWLLDQTDNPLISEEDHKKIEKISEKFYREKKREAIHDDILSQMTFGFWFSFFHSKYDPVIWQKKDAIRDVFPYLEKKNRKRSYIYNRIKVIKEIRNRIAHHEPVLNHKFSIDSSYKNCQELLRAMSPSAAQLLKMIDRFPKVRGYEIQTPIEDSWNKKGS